MTGEVRAAVVLGVLTGMAGGATLAYVQVYAPRWWRWRKLARLDRANAPRQVTARVSAAPAPRRYDEMDHVIDSTRRSRGAYREESTVDTTTIKPVAGDPLEPWAGWPDSHLLVGAPIIDGVTAFHWLRDRHPSSAGGPAFEYGGWHDVVAAFYNRAALSPEVYDYFVAMGVTMPKLQAHFTRALVGLMDKGLTVGTLRMLHKVHAPVVNSRKQQITGTIYDAVIGVLVEVLTDSPYRVHPGALGPVVEQVTIIRTVIVPRELASA